MPETPRERTDIERDPEIRTGADPIDRDARYTERDPALVTDETNRDRKLSDRKLGDRDRARTHDLTEGPTPETREVMRATDDDDPDHVGDDTGGASRI